jgi:hypothetical protein
VVKEPDRYRSGGRHVILDISYVITSSDLYLSERAHSRPNVDASVPLSVIQSLTPNGRLVCDHLGHRQTQYCRAVTKLRRPTIGVDVQLEDRRGSDRSVSKRLKYLRRALARMS